MPSTTKGFPYPLSSDNPNIPAHFQALAQAIDTKLNEYSLTDANTTYHFEGIQDDTDDVDLKLVGSDNSVDLVHFKAGNGIDITWDNANQRINIGVEADLAAIEALTGTSGLLKKTAANTWQLDTNSYSTTSHNHTIDSLSNVTISTLADGQVLKWNSTQSKWVNAADNTGAGNSFTTINGTAGSVVADQSGDTLTLAVSGGGLTITGTDTGTDTLTFALSSNLSNLAGSTLTGNGFIKLSGTTFSVDAAAYITGSSPTINTPALTLSTTSNTADGRISWDTSYHHAYIGDGSNLTLVPTFRVQTTAKTSAYTFVGNDANTLIQMSGAFAFTVPPNSGTGSVSYPVGTQIHLVALTTGVSVAAGTGVTINATPGLKLRAAYSSATLIKIGTDNWLLLGDLSA